MCNEFSKLRGRIKELYGSESKLAEVMNVSKQILNKKLNGKVRMTAEDIEVFSYLLKIPATEIPSYFFKNVVNFKDTITH